MASEIEIVDIRSPEALAILDMYPSGNIGTMEFATKMEAIRTKALARQTV
jgi:hypothetical protein